MAKNVNFAQGAVIKKALIDKQISAKELAGVLGVDDATISHWVNGRRTVPDRYKAEVERVLGIRLEGTGKRTFTWGAYSPDTQISIYGFAACGRLQFSQDTFDGGVPAANIKNPGNCFGVYATGSSMEPEIRDGDLLIFREVEGLHLPPKGEEFIPPNRLRDFRDKIVIATIDEETTIKRLKLVENGKHWHLQLQPDNRDFDTILLESNQSFTLNGVLTQLRRDY